MVLLCEMPMGYVLSYYNMGVAVFKAWLMGGMGCSECATACSADGHVCCTSD